MDSLSQLRRISRVKGFVVALGDIVEQIHEGHLLLFVSEW